tara:strand:+ start:272 stop:478 length:207 start_codon:yes stop_codon:yes gene_type:complete
VVAAARTDAVCAPTMLGGGGKAKAKKVAKKPKKVVKSTPRRNSITWSTGRSAGAAPAQSAAHAFASAR